MKKAYTNPYLEIVPLYVRDVVTESSPDPDADNDLGKDDIFG